MRRRWPGPSTFAHSIVLIADRDTLTQNGVRLHRHPHHVDRPDGQSENIPLRAADHVDGVAQDFGTLSTKTPITPTTIRYTAPPARRSPPARCRQTVTIRVTPTDSGDFRGEFARQIDIRLVPQGVILPTNPNLVAGLHVHAGVAAGVPDRELRRVDHDQQRRGLRRRVHLFVGLRRRHDRDRHHDHPPVPHRRHFQVTLTVTDARGAHGDDRRSR